MFDSASEYRQRARRRLVDRDQIAGKLAIKRTQLPAVIHQRPQMPEPIGYFRGRVLWDEAEIDSWIAAHAARDDSPVQTLA
jgi:predicted DNA-binding transcriptional regulator AlpA